MLFFACGITQHAYTIFMMVIVWTQIFQKKLSVYSRMQKCFSLLSDIKAWIRNQLNGFGAHQIDRNVTNRINHMYESTLLYRVWKTDLHAFLLTYRESTVYTVMKEHIYAQCICQRKGEERYVKGMPLSEPITEFGFLATYCSPKCVRLSAHTSTSKDDAHLHAISEFSQTTLQAQQMHQFEPRHESCALVSITGGRTADQ